MHSKTIPTIIVAGAVAALAVAGLNQVQPKAYGTNHPVCHHNEGLPEWNLLHLSVAGVNAHLANHPLDYVPQGDVCGTDSTTTEATTIPDTSGPVNTVGGDTTVPVDTTLPVESSVPPVESSVLARTQDVPTTVSDQTLPPTR